MSGEILDEEYWRKWEKGLDENGRLWLAVCKAKNQTERTKAYKMWHKFHFPNLYPQKVKVQFS